ncbi:MAG: Lrp/AsnC family transcriptional regulator [Oceanospirillales bacterium]|nr:MAG: Lrp/AsnC family transcriptional regulator [Oceanospirillales bacterium]
MLLDKFDLQILYHMQKNSRVKLAELAEKVCLSISQCSRRITRMEEEGVIRGYSVRLSSKDLGLAITAMVFISFEKRMMLSPREAMSCLLAHDEVIDCHVITGTYDFIIKVKVESMEALSNFLSRVVGSVDGIRDIASHIVMETLKENGPQPIYGINPR